MTFAVNIVRELTQDMLPPTVVLPPIVNSGLSTFHYIHGCWRWVRWGKRHLDPDNWLLIAADKGLHSLAGENQFLQAGAQLLLIITSINECVTGYIKLYRSYQKLKQAVWGNFPVLEEKAWAKSLNSSWISASFSHKMSAHFGRTVFYINRLAGRLFKFIQEMYTVCMLQVEATNSFSLEASKRQDDTKEVFSNAVKFFAQFTDNTALLATQLQKKKVAIQKIFSYINKNMSADDLISTIETFAKGAEKVNDNISQLHTPAAQTFLNMIKDTLYGATYIAGASESVRKYFIPELVEESMQENGKIVKPEEGYGRFAPKNWVTRLDKLPKSDIIKGVRGQLEKSVPSSREKVNSLSGIFQEIFA